MTSTLEPFEQLPFSGLPREPRIPHDYFAWPARDVRVVSRHFGAHRVRVRELGEGPPLLLLHGLMTSSYSFRYVGAALAARFRVYVPDFVGAGESDMPDVRYGVTELASWIAELQGALGIRGCDVVANSMAGYLAMRLALDDPQAIGRLVNVHSPGIVLPRLHALHVAMGLPRSESVLRAAVRLDPLRWVHRNVHYYDETLKSLEECRVYAAPLRTDEGLHAFARVLRETMAPASMKTFTADLEVLRRAGEPFPVDMLMLYAERDPMVPAEVGEQLRALVPSARFEWVREASHFMHVDAVPRFLAPTLGFLS